MVEAIADPGPEGVHPEERPFLTQLIELRIPIKQPRRDELVENTHRKRWQDGKKDVEKGE